MNMRDARQEISLIFVILLGFYTCDAGALAHLVFSRSRPFWFSLQFADVGQLSTLRSLYFGHGCSHFVCKKLPNESRPYHGPIVLVIVLRHKIRLAILTQ